MDITGLPGINEQILDPLEKQMHVLVHEGFELKHIGHGKSSSDRPPQPAVSLVVRGTEHGRLFLASKDRQHGLDEIRLIDISPHPLAFQFLASPIKTSSTYSTSKNRENSIPTFIISL